MFRLLLLAFFCVCLSVVSLAGQHFTDNPQYFREHLERNVYDIDSAAVAVVLYEHITYSIGDIARQDFHVTCTVHRIIKVLKKAGISEGDVSVTIGSTKYTYGGITKVKATTYNLDNGAVAVQQMPDNSIKIDRGSDNFVIGKFSLPSVSVGSVIDYSYETKEELGYLLGYWKIQETLPKLVTEATLIYPEAVKMALVTRNSLEFKEFDDEKAAVETPQSYFTPTRAPRGGYFLKSWVRKNIPGSFDEPFLFNLDNHTERIEFRVASARTTAYTRGHQVVANSSFTSWVQANTQLHRSKSSFGQLRIEKYRPAKQFLNKIGDPVGDRLEYAKKIHNYIRDSFNYKKGHRLYTGRDIDWVLKNNTGNHLDYHLALITALREADMDAYPVVISTRDFGQLAPDFPSMEKVNYVVTRLKLDGTEYFLDPTEKHLPFGVISPLCYNGFGWAVDDMEGFAVQLNPSGLKERMVVLVKTVSNDASDYQLCIRKVYGKYGAANKRKEWIEDSTLARKEIVKEVKSLRTDIKLLNYVVHNLHNADTNLVVEYNIGLDFSGETQFFVPSLYNYYREAPLKAQKRVNPVEFSYPTDINYSLQLTLPAGYTIEELPASGVFKYDEDDYYKYLISFDKESNSLMLNTKFNFQRVSFAATEYADLKAYFDKVMEMQQKAVLIKKAS